MDNDEDMPMEPSSPADAEMKPVADKSVAEKMDEKVFELLRGKFSGVGEMKTLGYTAEDVMNIKAPNVALSLLIQKTYPSVPRSAADEVVETLAELVTSAWATKTVSPAKGVELELYQRLEYAFTRLPYYGDAGNEFRDYLNRCWTAYSKNPELYKAPYVAIVQSSGFGKSRLLRQLAQETSQKPNGSLRVLYTCTRLQESSGFPVATTALREWLFASDQSEISMAGHLEAIYYYALQNWSNIGRKWLDLFTVPEFDREVTRNLANLEKRLKDLVKPKSSAQRLVVLAIDEARALLLLNNGGVNYFRLLRKALKIANENIQKWDDYGGIFAVLVDTNSTVSDLTPPLTNDNSSRIDEADHTYALFPPFVLAHTMDIYWRQKFETDALSAYKVAVMQTTKGNAFDDVVSMGRPMWKSTFNASMEKYNNEFTATNTVLNLAARKLLLGKPPRKEESYNESTLFGVASMMCRLGLRPYARSALASRLVADFMAILAYVKHENDGQLTSYTSDPVLALGAARVWYNLDAGLPKHILPQLKKLLLNETLDTGGVGEVIARITLLLAVDTCVVEESGRQTHRDCKFKGQFVSVQLFMKAMVGFAPAVKMERQADADKNTKTAFNKWRAQWKGWQMGFCHFVQLVLEPTEETLWILLGRRAAGVLPRNQNGADLVIPMFSGSKVSFILVQVKNVSGHDSSFPGSATTKLHPSFVFSPENPLSKKSPLDVIRVYMSLREAEERFIRSETVTEDAATDNTVTAFTLCIRSMRIGVLQRNTRRTVGLPILPQTEAVVKALNEMASPLWDPVALARGDLSHRESEEKHSNEAHLSKVMPDDKALEITRMALLHDTLGGYVKEKQAASTGRAGVSVLSSRKQPSTGKRPAQGSDRRFTRSKR